MTVPRWDDEAAWSRWRNQWDLRDDTIYLNHGSFGPSPRSVRAARRRWLDQLEQQPMDFLARRLEPAWLASRRKLAQFVGTIEQNLVFVENSTAGMNLVAHNFPLQVDEQVVLTNHEYGAVFRIWDRACRRKDAHLVTARLPQVIESAEHVVDSIFAAINQQTRLLVVSHITSATALILPIDAICHRARQMGVAVCIDGPHAPAQIPLNIDQIGCDFYTASCHKWLCAPFGSGFLTVAKPYQETFQPSQLSWGRMPPDQPEAWWDEFVWSGTGDRTPFLATSDAIDFFQDQIGLDAFRQRTHALARYARRRIVELVRCDVPFPDSPEWYGSMALVPLPRGEAKPLQNELWQQHGIEVPIIDFEQQRFIRVSCHLYNTPSQIDTLVEALRGHLQ